MNDILTKMAGSILGGHVLYINQRNRTPLDYCRRSYRFHILYDVGVRDLRIERNRPLEQALLDTITRHEIRPRTGLHVTDLTRCLRMTVYLKLNPKYHPKAALHFLRGKSLHRLIEDYLVNPLSLNLGESEVSGTISGVQGTADVVTYVGTSDESVWEIKTVAAIYKDPIQPYIHHLEQLSYYMLAFDRSAGHLVYFMLAQPIDIRNPYSKREPDLLIWTTKYDSQGDTQLIRSQLNMRKRYILKALIAQDPLAAPVDQSWCNLCEYTAQCPVARP